MKEIIITKQNEDTKLLRMLSKLLPDAGMNFLYKMLRKKNITLNEKKASGAELLKSGDIIRIFLSDETYKKFEGKGSVAEEKKNTASLRASAHKLKIIYEDDDILLSNKPAGILSQKSSRDDVSMVDIIADYLKEKGEYDPHESIGFKPAVANRLDRNTSGIIAAGKSVSGLKLLSDGFKNRNFEKLYLCVVKGELKRPVLLNGLWSKDSHGNRAIVKNVEIRELGELYSDISTLRLLSFPSEYFKKGNIPVQTVAEPVVTNGKATLCLIKLLTGKTHQIRAQMAEAGYPLLGDHKYGDRAFNEYFKDVYGIEFQLLHAYILKIPEKGVFFADIPDYFMSLLKGEGLWTDSLTDA